MTKLFAAFALMFTVNKANDIPDPTPIEVAPVVDVAADHSEAWRAFLTERRAEQKQRLAAYIAGGEFPWNEDQPGLVNIFVDDDGVHCAMANLVRLDGHGDLTRRIGKKDNDYVFTEGVDGELEQWLLTSGLTLEEAAVVQVPDMQIEPDWPSAAELRVMEIDRIQGHLSLALAQLENNEAASLDLAVERLGDRVFEAPPTPGA